MRKSFSHFFASIPFASEIFRKISFEAEFTGQGPSYRPITLSNNFSKSICFRIVWPRAISVSHLCEHMNIHLNIPWAQKHLNFHWQVSHFNFSYPFKFL